MIRYSVRSLVGLMVFISLFLPVRVADAGPYIVVNARTGAVVDQSDANTPWYPASLTKLMTAYVTFEAIKAGRLTLESPVRVSKLALSQPPSKMGFKVGTVMTVDNALKMVIVKSANDIAVALGETVSGSHDAFISEMNRTARALGMNRTHFVNPNGLPDNRMRTTARDMALLGLAIRKAHPQYAHYFRIPAIRHGKRVLRSYNKLLEHFQGTNGMKTGFICASGFNIVASAKRGNTELVAVVLGALTANERAEMTANLLHHGFKGRGLDNKRGTSSSLQGLKPAGFGPTPVNLRPQVCNGSSAPKVQAQKNSANSYLGPRVRILDPVRVRTGLSNGRAVAGALPSRVPTPRARPVVLSATIVQKAPQQTEAIAINPLPKGRPPLPQQRPSR